MNVNLQLAQIFVDELAKGGVQEVCIAPGSRSTPLALAFTRQPRIRVYMHLDERSAAFYALGLSLALARPVAVLCTSGSAAANFMPAVVEARMSGVPLLVLTADRSPELRGSGANQTIDQIKFYGGQVLWSVDAPLPVDGQPELVVRHMRTLAARALSIADSILKGPVHINFPFRKPLEPMDDAGFPPVETGQNPFTQMERGVLLPTDGQMDALAKLAAGFDRGLIVCGPRCPAGEFPAAVAELAQHSGYPMLADPLSGLRFNAASEGLIGGYDNFLAVEGLQLEEPQLVIRFGAVPTSAVLAAYLERIRPVQRVQIAGNGVWADDAHRTSWFLQADEAAVCQQLARRLDFQGERSYTYRWQQIEETTWNTIRAGLSEADVFDGIVVAQTLRALLPGSNLFMGNSLAIRHLDQFGQPCRAGLRVFGNRGASGIDGNVSTALGIAAAQPERTMAAILGDITFYHDLNGLMVVKQQQLCNAIFIVLNNHGGGIFRRLPVARFEPPFTQAFLTPHDLVFSYVAEMYGLEYVRVESRAALDDVFSKVFTPGAEKKSRLVEVETDGAFDHQQRQAIMEKVALALRRA